MNEVKIRNRIKEVAASRGVSNRLIALKCNVHYTTVSQWFSNRQQPSIENTIKILKLLEVDFTDIMIYESQPINTGLGRALEDEYKNLVKQYPLIVELPNLKTKAIKKSYNPLIIEALDSFEEKYKTKEK
ncbi:helix-turn-helix transcriptional regulator [Myroides odoratimimus]|uniref:helix-turn-helix transcriptional regulator n=1 Tax=Myroides odoratimimus TaxID=76832 RepID=UPI0024BFBB89|nr:MULTISPECIES: helix-turn-helix transcriptional regulator [Myroides]MDM1465248.1 helix-turn-helix transcriptional regulator [Myroides odoratimimus]MDM1475252.1 helix-turn-helix transcriptional regulator [Myroides odoratimimus]WHT39514.1 helix-turn-helix transcriptional regulator [Myroides sp. mNGS23_01]